MSKSPEIQATLEELLNAQPFLARVLAVKADATLRYHALKLSRLVDQETKHFTDEQRALIKELGTERPPTGAERAKHGPDPVTEVMPINRKAYMDRVKELLAVKAAIAWSPITNAMIEKYDDITAEICNGLGPLFELDPATDAKE